MEEYEYGDDWDEEGGWGLSAEEIEKATATGKPGAGQAESGLIFSLLERFGKGKQHEKSTRFLSKTGAFGRG